LRESSLQKLKGDFLFYLLNLTGLCLKGHSHGKSLKSKKNNTFVKMPTYDLKNRTSKIEFKTGQISIIRYAA
jgi:hypothetical protein